MYNLLQNTASDIKITWEEKDHFIYFPSQNFARHQQSFLSAAEAKILKHIIFEFSSQICQPFMRVMSLNSVRSQAVKSGFGFLKAPL